MKKVLSLSLICLLLVGVIFALASCQKTLYGTYEGVLYSYEFQGNKVTRKATVLGASISVEGTYEIKKNDKDEYEITFTYGEGADASYSGTWSFNEGSDSKGSYIEIGGLRFNKK